MDKIPQTITFIYLSKLTFFSKFRADFESFSFIIHKKKLKRKIIILKYYKNIIWSLECVNLKSINDSCHARKSS